MDDLDNAIEQTLKTNDKAVMGNPTTADPLDSAVDSVINIQQARQRATLKTATGVNPDEAAKANALAAKRGLPPDLVLRNLPQVQQQDQVEHADALLATSPALAAKMRELPFAQVAHDSVDTLAGIENQIKTYGEFRAARGPEPTLGSYLTGVWQSVKSRTKQADIGLSMQIGDLAESLGFGTDPVRRQELKRRYAQAQSDAAMTTPEFKSDTAKGIYGGVSSTVSMLPVTAMSILMRNPTPALAAMGIQTEAEAYGKYRTRGASAGEALLGGVGEGAVEVLTEKIPMGFLVDKFGKTGAKQFLAGMLLREAPSEQVATLLQDAIDTAVANPEKTWGEYAAERPAAAYQTLLATLVQAGTMGGASAVVQKVAERAQRQQEQAQQDGQFIGDLLKNAAENKLRERDPSAFAALTQAAAEQHGAPTEVFIDANALIETLAQSGMTPQQIEAALPSTSKTLAEAAVAGGDVSVPIGEFTALVAGSGMETQLAKHARLSPDALSQEDAKLLAKVDLKAETEKAMAEQEVQAEGAQVKQQLLDQLNTAGRFSPAVNQAYADSVAAIYETQAERLGISVVEFAKRYPLKVEGFGTEEGPRAFNQNTNAPTIGQVLDRTGAPMNLTMSKQTFGIDAKAPNAVLVELRDPANNERRGFIDFSIGEDGVLRSENTKVAPALRGRGLAEAMYQAARNAGYDIAPGRVQTEAGQKMVEKLQAKGLINKQTEVRQRAADVAAPLRQSDSFKAWFGDSKVVDKDGKPLVVYHGTASNVPAFDPATSGTKSNTGAPEGTFFFTDKADVASSYTVKWQGDFSAQLHDGANVMPVYLSIQKPLKVNAKGESWREILYKGEFRDINEIAQIAKQSGKYDGVIVSQVRDKGVGSVESKTATTYIAFTPEQIKSAIGNDGTFDPNDPSILSQDAKGTFTPSTNTIALLAKADLSTFHHELGHFYLEVLADMASKPDAPAAVVEDMNRVLEWFGVKGTEQTGDGPKTGELAQTSLVDKLKSMQRKVEAGKADTAKRVDDMVQKQRALEGMRAAMRDPQTGQIYTGWSHQAAINSVPKGDTTGAWGRLSGEWDRETDNTGFVDRDGNFITRTEAEAQWGVSTMEDIKDARKKLYQDGTDAGSTEPVTPKRTPLETWRAMSLDQQREFHEKFARGYEAYLFEGKAPSTALSRAFQRFSEWMRKIYKSIRALDVELNDDIRRVYDRMLASEQAIKEAEAARAYAPLFADEKTLKETGVDPAAYHALGAEATAEAVDQLQARSMRDMRWLANAKDRALKELQKEAKTARAAVEAQVREEVGRQPIYAAENFLRRGVLPETERNNAQRKALDATQGMNTKLDLPTLKEMYGDAPAAPWRYLATGKTGLATAKDGLHPDVVAEIFGFPSGDAMVRELLAAEPQAQVIEGMTDQRMLEEHGELASPDALERAAEQAIRNEARGKFIATELAALDKAIGPARVLVKAAKDFAASILGRKVITEIKPHVFVAAETRAAKLAEKSIGKVEEAATAKRNQLLNHYAARYAYEAQNEVAKIREFFARVANTPDDRLKNRDMDVVNAARAVLAAYGVGRRGEAAAEYLKKVATYDPEMSGVLQGSVDAAMQNAKPLDELTLDELRALNDEVASLWHLAKRSRQMEVDGNLLDREDVQDQLKARLDEIGIPDTMPGDLSAITPAEARIAKLKTYLASARRTEGWVEAMDGKPSGVFRSFIWQPVKEAADAYRADKSAILKKFRELLKPIEKTLTKRLIEAPELGYTFGKDTGGVAMNEILHAIAHTGNESNKRKLLLGRDKWRLNPDTKKLEKTGEKWATENPDGTLDTRDWDAFINRLATEGTLKKEHFDFVQGVWDLLEETKPLAQKTHRDVFGKYFAEVTADTLTTPFGQYRGGYVPALADPRIVSDAKTRQLMEDENASMTFAFPSTNKGFTKGRVEYNRPLMLDLQTLSQHIDKVLLFGHMERPIRDVRRVLTSKGVAYGVNRIDPAAFDAIITPWLNRAARQQVTTPTPGHWQSWRLWSTLRNRAGMAAMFGNVINAAQQITGFSIAAVKVRPKYMLGAMAHYVTNPREMANAVAEASPYMEGRMRNEVAAMNDQIKDILIDPGLYERAQQWSMRHAYFLQSAVDNVMSPVIWTAARNQALEQGQSEKEAARFADATVRQTQGSTLPEDISNFEAGSSFSRMFTQFAGYFNMQANLLGTEFQTIARDIGLRKGAGRGLYVLTMGFLVPAWISELIVQAAKGGPDDEDKDGEYLDDWLAAVFGFSTLRGLTAMLPIFGQGVNAGVNATNSKPYDDRLATSPAISMIESAFAGNIGTLYKSLFEGKEVDKSKAVKDVASLISLLTGIPANIAARPLSYMVDVAEGDVQPTSSADAVRGVVTGRASPDSKR